MSRTRRGGLVGLLFLVPGGVGLGGCGGGPAADAPAGWPGPPDGAFHAAVVRVVDGDTLLARRDGRTYRVRLIGINAPESVKPDSPVECYGPSASKRMHQLLPTGSAVLAAYEPGGRRDQYGRELWDVWLADGRFLQAQLVHDGAARARLYRPQHEYADLLASVQRQAQRSGAGLWGSC